MGETRLNRLTYDHSPLFVQNLMASIYGWQKNRYRYGSPLAKHWLKFYLETAKWPEEQLREYQVEQMRRTVAYAYQHVPFYRKRFDCCGLKPEDIKTVEDLGRLPYLTKQEIREAGTDLISDEYKVKDLFANPTSGSTGMPLILYSNREAIIKNFTFRLGSMPAWVYPERRIRTQISQGWKLLSPDQKKPPYWRMNYASRQRLYSIFHMSERLYPTTWRIWLTSVRYGFMGIHRLYIPWRISFFATAMTTHILQKLL